MAVTPPSSTQKPTPPDKPAPANPKGDMGSQDTFMKLLVAELKYQDPMDPLQNRDMVAQLATLSSVQKLTGIDDKLGGMQQSSLRDSSLQSAGLIGKTVTAKTNRLTLSSIGDSAGGFRLANDAKSVKVSVLDSQGNTVKSVDLGTLKQGQCSFSWDGKGINGQRVAPGNYTFQIDAADAAGAPVVASTEVSGLVSEVAYTNGTPEIVIGDARVGISDVTSVAQ
jgi:flagellar basal-body rod modification protein FlgD